MKRSDPAYFFLIEVVAHSPEATKRCPSVWVDTAKLEPLGIVLAAGMEGYLTGKIDDRTLRAVLALHGPDDPQAWLQISEGHLPLVYDALEPGTESKPIFSWLPTACLGNGYNSLLLADTKRFIAFLRQAWVENWPTPRLKTWVKKSLAIAPGQKPRFRDFELPRKLVKAVNTSHLERPCVLHYFG